MSKQNQPLKAVLVGCGNMSNAWLHPAMGIEGLSIVGLVDLSPEAARKRANQYNLGEGVVFNSLGDAIKATSPDLVFDVTIPEAHTGVTLEALAAGCHVLGEKPMATSLEDAQEMVTAAQHAGRLYAVIQNRRYEPNIRRVRQAVEQNIVGRVNEIHSDFFLGPHFGGFRDAMDYPLLVDMAIHTFDQARYISQADPVSVYCHSFNPGHSWYKGDASAICIFEMSDGLVYSYRGSWCAPGLSTSWNADWRLVGENGVIRWNGDDQVTAQITQPHAQGSPLIPSSDPVIIPPMTLEHQGHEGLIREFVDCVRTGQRPMTHCEDNLKSLAMVLAAVKSAKSGQREPVSY